MDTGWLRLSIDQCIASVPVLLLYILTRALLRLERTMNLLEGGKGREDGGERVGREGGGEREGGEGGRGGRDDGYTYL